MALDLSQYDLDNIGIWPVWLKSAVIAVLCAVVFGAGYWFDTRHQLVKLDQEQKRQDTLLKDFEKKQAKAASLEAYRQQMAEMEESFGTMLRQLPSKTEVADLLVDITQTGLASGLEFTLFQPKSEIPKEFYAELPISLRITGQYHEFGAFVSGVAALPRIVTLHDIKISKPTAGRGRSAGLTELSLEATAKTYRYLDDEEVAQAAAAKKPARAARKKKGK